MGPGLLLDKTVTRCAIMADSSPTKVKGTNNVLVYKEVTDDRITFVIQNKSESSTNIQLDLSKSKNIITNKSSSVFGECWEEIKHCGSSCPYKFSKFRLE